MLAACPRTRKISSETDRSKTSLPEMELQFNTNACNAAIHKRLEMETECLLTETNSCDQGLLIGDGSRFSRRWDEASPGATSR